MKQYLYYIYIYIMRVTLLYYYKTYFSSSLILHSSMNVSHKCSYNHFTSPVCAVKQNMTEHMNIEHTKMDKKWRTKIGHISMNRHTRCPASIFVAFSYYSQTILTSLIIIVCINQHIMFPRTEYD